MLFMSVQTSIYDILVDFGQIVHWKCAPGRAEAPLMRPHPRKTLSEVLIIVVTGDGSRCV